MDIRQFTFSSNYLFPCNPSLEEEMIRLFADYSSSYKKFGENDAEFASPPPQPPLGFRKEEKKEYRKPAQTICVFCRKNGEAEEFYKTHSIKDANGRVLCPVLRAYTCPICKAFGDQAHTIKYCLQNNKLQPTKMSINSFGKLDYE